MEKIVAAKIGHRGGHLSKKLPEVMAKFEDGTSKVLFNFFADEISFMEEELVGLTEQQAHDLKFQKDRDYLRS